MRLWKSWGTVTPGRGQGCWTGFVEGGRGLSRNEDLGTDPSWDVRMRDGLGWLSLGGLSFDNRFRGQEDHLPQVHICSPHTPCDGIWRWGLRFSQGCEGICAFIRRGGDQSPALRGHSKWAPAGQDMALVGHQACWPLDPCPPVSRTVRVTVVEGPALV